jgi:hypothetical protein
LQSPRARPGELVIVAKHAANCQRSNLSRARGHGSGSGHRLCSTSSAGWPS